MNTRIEAELIDANRLASDVVKNKRESIIGVYGVRRSEGKKKKKEKLEKIKTIVVSF
jgi:hypothetical protein